MIGCGSVFRHYSDEVIVPLASEGRVNLVVAADPNPLQAEAVRARFPDARFSSDPGAVIAAEVDIVAVLTPTPFHSAYAKAALQAGKHVMVEKPMAITLDEAAELVEVAESSDRYLLCAPHVFMTKTFQELHRRVTAGEIGRVHQARASYGFSPPRTRDWAWYWQKDAGPMFDLGVYNLTSLVGIPGKRATSSRFERANRGGS